jgi:hypothetical protein
MYHWVTVLSVTFTTPSAAEPLPGTKALTRDGDLAAQLRFPPVVLFTDGRDYWLGDGFHRVLGAHESGLGEIAAEVRPGTPRSLASRLTTGTVCRGTLQTSAKRSAFSWPIRNGASGATGKLAGAARSITKS